MYVVHTPARWRHELCLDLDRENFVSHFHYIFLLIINKNERNEKRNIRF